MQAATLSPNELIKDNLLYAKRLARRFYRKRAHSLAELDDLESAAYLGLCEAASRYDISKASKFQTYSYMRIVGAMYDYLVTSGGYSRSNYHMLEGQKTLKGGPTLRVARDLIELSRAQSLIEEWGVKVEVNLKKGSIDLLYPNKKLADEKLLQAELMSKLETALIELPLWLRELVSARYLEGKTLNELALLHPELSKSSISRSCNKGLKELKKKLNIIFQ